MNTRLLGAVSLAGALAAGCGMVGNEGERQAAVVHGICLDCHNAAEAVGGLNLESRDLDAVAADAETWEKAILKLRSGLMPPPDGPELDPEARSELVAWLEDEIDSHAETHLPAPGLHRLNRTEYTNAIRDLLAVHIDATTFLPPDDSSSGFDNMAGTLTTSPALMEAYLSAAGNISRLAIGTETAPTLAVFDVPVDTSQNTHIEGLPFGTRGGMLIEHEFPADGEYVFTVKGMTGYFTAVLGNVKGEKLEVTIDGERVYLYDWDTEIGNQEGNGGRTPAIPIKAGFHKVGVTFIATSDLPDTGLNKSFVRTMNSPGAISGYTFYPHVGQVFIEGPYNGVPATSTQSREKIFECYPQSDVEEADCARRIISTLARRAFRRPSTDADLETLMAFFRAGRGGEGGSFDDGIQAVVQRILADPEFIYRSEIEPDSVAPGQPYRISDLELASRLSFFLWSSIPDDELIQLGAEGRLHDPEVLRQQVERMIADPRSEALVENFTGQWLNVRGMQASEPVVELFPNFDSTLREAYRREIDLFFGSIIKEDRSILDLLTADYTFVNERLARQYGIPDIYGSQFRRVTLGPELDMRRGLLGKGALLTVTSDAARTSPVKRGKWFLETFFGVTPPAPPPGVNTNLPGPAEGEAPKTLRAQMEAHHTNPNCAACHNIFEPMGFVMENFDAVGKWRTKDAGNPIDATGVTSDGTHLDGIKSLRELAVRNGDLFAEVVTEKLLTYAIGRGLDYEDMPLVRSLTRKAAEDDYRFSSLLMGVIQSPAFTMNLKSAASQE